MATCVVLALTGFSTGRGHGHGSSHSGGDGGCSSSGQDHDSSSSSGGASGSRYHDYDRQDDDDDDTGGGSGSSTLQDATVRLIDCASPSRAYATVEVTNPNATSASFTVTVAFLDAGSGEVEERTEDAYVAGNGTETVKVGLSAPGVEAKVDHCAAEPYAPAN
ncbi:hypothetical protein GCM10010269_33320 [Streptomyces humidus]|uniref:Uncharacterized protein n=1 Tax=Streptomyces humidus TaxID=52259 RepID=A0A918FVL8_9ACTN|nr:hypothetical protein [Streptomyces humidus]GGR91521.1 hypothetical protein GCM10010269_33320 [Streptomyces humidus]